MQSSRTKLFDFQLFTDENRAQNVREGEIKLSSKVKFGNACDTCQYVILGISEDIGPQMNSGFPGADLGFSSFVKTIQSVQSNMYLKGDEIGILGEIMQSRKFHSKSESAGWVEELDEFVEEILNSQLKTNQQLIVIGGGHNNAFPLLTYASKRSKKKIQSINIDPHADCRSLEYRHSGNPFSFAMNNGILENYAVFGLHESYNNDFIINYLNDHNCFFSTFESFIDDEKNWWIEWGNYLSMLSKDHPIVLDIDMDAIQFSPSSALTPSGFHIEHIRKLIRNVSNKKRIEILHLPEGAPKSEMELRVYGKMISYFVLDFIKCQNSQM